MHAARRDRAINGRAGGIKQDGAGKTAATNSHGGRPREPGIARIHIRADPLESIGHIKAQTARGLPGQRDQPVQTAGRGGEQAAGADAARCQRPNPDLRRLAARQVKHAAARKGPEARAASGLPAISLRRRVKFKPDIGQPHGSIGAGQNKAHAWP